MRTLEELRAMFYEALAPALNDQVYDKTCPVCQQPIRWSAVATRGRPNSRSQTRWQPGPVCVRCYGGAPSAQVLTLVGDVVTLPCERCGMPVGQIEDPRRRRWTCSTACRVALWKAENRADSRNTADCADCGRSFTPARSDARYCSPGCRQHAYRQRREDPLVF